MKDEAQTDSGFHDSPLAEVYVVTRYTEKDGVLTAHTKYDVTRDFNRIVEQRADLAGTDQEEER